MQNEGLWGKIMNAKYIALDSMEDYIQKRLKVWGGGSIIWKALVKAFPLLGKWLVWNIRK
jgi:hypothetical protein